MQRFLFLKTCTGEFSEVRWSGVARKATEKKVADLELLERLTSKSRLTEKDVEEISSKIKRGVMSLGKYFILKNN